MFSNDLFVLKSKFSSAHSLLIELSDFIQNEAQQKAIEEADAEIDQLNSEIDQLDKATQKLKN